MFDGKGGFNASVNSNYNGTTVPEIYSGTYVIDKGCKIKMNYTLGGTAYIWFGGLDYENTGATVMVTSPQGSVVVGTLRHQ